MWKLFNQAAARRAATLAAVTGVLWAAVHGQPASAVKIVVARAAASPASAASAPAYKPSPYATVARQHAQAASATPLTNSLQSLRHQHRPTGQGHQ